MPDTFTLIASSTVGAPGASSIDFTSIPSTYTDLVIKTSIRTNRSADNDYLVLKFNGSGTGYSVRMVQGNGSTASSNSDTLIYSPMNGNTTTANTFNNNEIYIPNYAGNNQKSVSMDGLYENNATAVEMRLMAGLWTGTAAINQCTLTSYYSSTFLQYSTAYLYGVNKS